MSHTRICIISIAIALFSGCASTFLPPERLASETAGVIGVPPSQITISDVRTEGTNTYYIARTKAGKKYACVINGGNALTLGLVNPPKVTEIK
jgi:hypothetical protein